MMAKKNLKIALISFIFLCINMPFTLVNAQQTKKPHIDDLLYKFDTPGEQAPTTTDYIATLPDTDAWVLMGEITWYLLIVANVLAFLSFVVAGIYMIISQGNEELTGKTKEIFTYTVIAMVIAAAALAIVTGVTNMQFF